MKLSTEKSNLPGRKQLVRQYEDGAAVRDIIATEDEPVDGTPLLEQVMAGGDRTEAGASRPVAALRERASARRTELPARLRTFEPDAAPYEIVLSDALEERLRSTREALQRTMTAETP